MASRNPIPRQQVLAHIIETFEREPFTTCDLAVELGINEYRVRGAVSWLMLGGALVKAGRVARKDKRGCAYFNTRYRWTGQTDAPRVPHDPQARARHLAEHRRTAHQDVVRQALSMRWV